VNDNARRADQSAQVADYATENERLREERAELRAMLAAFKRAGHSREIANLEAQLAAFQAQQPPPEPYIALKAINRHGYDPATVWRWARHGLIDTKRENKRWFCRQPSVNASIAQGE
jgi:hypothetical protein